MKAEITKEQLPNSPLIAAYVTSLERALAHSEDRDEIVASVCEHIVEALRNTDPADPERVRLVLEELGPIERIATFSGASTPGVNPVVPSNSWAANTAAVAAFLSLGLVFVLPFIAVPLAIGALLSGLLMQPGNSSRRGPAAWLAITVSTTSLLIAILGALFLLPQGEPVPASSFPAQTAPSQEATPIDP